MKKEPDDRNKLKIASFRTTDGDWFDFCQVAESSGLTATDVLKACMVEYQAGIYTPSINTPVSMRLQAAQGLTAEEARSIADSAIEQALVPIREILSSTRVGTHTDLTADSVQLAIDRAVQPLHSSINAVRNNLDDHGADVADLREQLAKLKPTTTASAPAKATTKKTPAKPKGV